MPRQSVRAILLDIEGTTTPVDFVYEILFPFARQNVREFLQQHYESDQVRAIISALRVEKSAENPERSGGQPPPWDEGSTNSLLESVTQYVYWLMDQDRKSTALKELQGQIWKDGYLDGQLQSQIYPDVLPAFKRWKEQQRDIHIFSSGSVLAQKLLFAHTTEGDLAGFISGYFDTTTGAKSHAASFRSISETIGIRSTEVLFVSDVNAELDAARESGMETILCVRAGNLETGSAAHQITHDFNEVFP